MNDRPHDEAIAEMHSQDWAARGPSPFPPPWACAWGDDRYGVWADFEVGDVHARMRWIESGRFLMGSPNGVGESDEHLQHLVSITQGFWLADTVCTQALWQKVLGRQQGRFTAKGKGKGGPDRPVESVSLKDISTFLGHLQQYFPGSKATLPTNAEWTYAHRVDPSTALSLGDPSSLQQPNFAVEDSHHPDGHEFTGFRVVLRS